MKKTCILRSPKFKFSLLAPSLRKQLVLAGDGDDDGDVDDDDDDGNIDDEEEGRRSKRKRKEQDALRDIWDTDNFNKDRCRISLANSLL